MAEIISIHIGNAGVQLGNICWELFHREHQINFQGKIDNLSEISPKIGNFYAETVTGSHLPRALFIDSEPRAVEDLIHSSYGNLYDARFTQYFKKDAGNLFAEGMAIGKESIQEIANRIRTLAENCSNLQGFLLYFSCGGGSGSGIGSCILDQLSIDFPDKAKVSFVIYPSPEVPKGIIEPYNAVLCNHYLQSSSSATVAFDNGALYDICNTTLGIPAPSLADLNRIAALSISSITSSFRFKSTGFSSLSDFCKTLAMPPIKKFLVPGYAPLFNASQNQTCEIEELVEQAYENQNLLVKISSNPHKLFASTGISRGSFDKERAKRAVENTILKKTVELADWCDLHRSCSLSKRQPLGFTNSELVCLEKTVCSLSNTSGIKEMFDKIHRKVDLMYCKRAYVHWYVRAGMSEAEMSDAIEEFMNLQVEYTFESL